MLERHCGVTFDEASDPTAVREELRDHADDDGVVLRMALLPSRLFQGLAAVRGELGAVEIAADAYQGTARIAAGAVDGPLVAQVRAAIEKLGGTLGAVSSDPGSDVAAAASQPSGESLRLASQLEGVFDPAGVLWPCRT